MTAYRRTTPAELDAKIADAHRILADARAEHFKAHREAGCVLLFSGGNDSTILAHLMRSEATHAAHANTGIGIEQTRQFVRDTCSSWGLPLLERSATHPSDSYEALVIEQGFPGPGMHFKMYQRLKERALRQVRAELVSEPRRAAPARLRRGCHAAVVAGFPRGPDRAPRRSRTGDGSR